ncbi:MAG: TonB-dependent receptor [Mediterranea sp.]|jgi:TonB-linked SusC/RagA family outer membrane protein|nr:TonB-dependent receptor [Mediterranea sp.]
MDYIKIKRQSLLFLLFLIPVWVYSQNITVKGVIEDASGEPVIGANILQKGTTNGIISDINGNFRLNVPRNATLVVSFLGYQSQEIPLNGRNSLTIVLKEDTKMLDEVVITNDGYSTMRRSDLTGSVVSVGAASIEKSVPTTIDQALQGKVSGLIMMQNSGVPGGGSSIQIRGVNSINSSNEPIYVVDGMIISGSTGSNQTNAIAGINPADIESMEVLKDASATAIYGSQAANGVIIITMKKGKEGQPKVNFNTYYGHQELPNKIDMMKLPAYAQHYNELQHAYGYDSNRKDAFSHPETLSDGTDWQDAIFGGAGMQSYNLSVRGGNRTNNYSISGGYMNQDGITVGSGFERVTLRVASDVQVRNWLKVGGTVNVGYTEQETSIANWEIIPNALFQSPQVPVLNADGSYGGPDSAFDSNLSGYNNPLGKASLMDRDNKKFNARSNLYIIVQPVKWFNYRSEFTGEGTIDNYQYFLPAYEMGSSINSYADTQAAKTFSLSWTWKNLFNFNYTLHKDHRFTLMLGQEMNSYHREYLQGQRTHGANDLKGLDAGDANYATNSGNSSNRKFVSFFGRLLYNYKDRYLFTGTFRNDGSSNFAQGYQWGVFPSAAVAWRVSEEPFFKPLKKAVNNLKFRLSYGEVGNSNVSAFAYESILANVQSNWGIGLRTGNIPNELLTWETTRSWNAGIDFNFLDNRIELIADVYIKKTDDLLMQLDLPGYLGTSGNGAATAPWYNIGAMENKGVEFTLNTTNIVTKSFKWNSSASFSLNRNEITRMNSEAAFINRTYQLGGVTSTVTHTAVGHPISQFWGYNVIGRINSAADFLTDNGDGTSTVKVATVKYRKGDVITNNASSLPNSTYIGDLLFEDIDGNGIVDDADRSYIGNPLPRFIFGFTNTFTYKGIDLSIMLYGSVGNKAFNWLRRRIDDPNSTGNLRNTTANYCQLGYRDGDSENKDIWNVYVLPGAEDSQVRIAKGDPNTNNTVSSRFVEDASYLRIQNISIGYTLPRQWVKKLKLEKLRLYANLQNVYTFTKYLGYDPEIGSTQGQYSYSGQDMLMYGVDTGRVPTPRIYTIGFDLTF